MDGAFKIPLQTSHGLVDLVIKPHEFGNANMVTVIIPAELKGKIVLPRNMFSNEIRKALKLNFGEVAFNDG